MFTLTFVSPNITTQKEILTKEVSVEAYWEKDKIEEDIKEVLKV